LKQPTRADEERETDADSFREPASAAMTMSDREGLIARIRLIRRPTPALDRTGDRPAADAADPQPEALRALETRVAHLESLLQGLQDSVHRESKRHSELIAELQAQVEPAAIRAALAEDARQRGL
jgi:Tfp pilus assembly protein FimV